jgi:hypothetical protein
VGTCPRPAAGARCIHHQEGEGQPCAHSPASKPPGHTHKRCKLPNLLLLLQEYCINKEQYDWLGEVTKFKTQGLWGVDPLKEVPAKTKAAFTRAFNAQVG